MKRLIFLIIFLYSMTLVFAIPSIENLTLNATSKYNLISDNLTCNFNLNNSATGYTVEWRKNNTYQMNLIMPFKIINTSLKDFSNKNNNVSIPTSAIYNETSGHDGSGAYNFQNSPGMLINYSTYINNSVGSFAVWFKQKDGFENCAYNLNLVKSSWPIGFDFAIEGCTNQLYFDPISGRAGLWTTFVPTLNQWYFAVVTWDANNDTNLKMYINGTEYLDTVPYSPNNWSVPNPDQWFIIGETFNGDIEGIDYYNYVLSADDVLKMYNNKSVTVMDSSDLMLNHIWQCRVTPYNFTEIGIFYLSNNLTLVDYPGLSNVILNSTSGLNYSSDNITCNYNLTNASVTASVDWYKDNLPTALNHYPIEGSFNLGLNDYSGNNNTLRCGTNCPLWNSTGGYNGKGAYVFNATYNNKVLFYNLSKNYVNVTDYTIGVWFKAQNENSTSQNVNSRVVSLGDNGLANSYYQLATHASSKMIFCRNAFNATYQQNVEAYLTIQANKWYFTVCTFSNNTMKIYVDGVLMNTSSFNKSVISSANNNVFLVGNAFAYGGTRQFTGTIDEIINLNYSISDEDVMEMFNNKSYIIDSDDLTLGSVYQCRVTPFSYLTVGDTISSNNITIVAAPTCTISSNITFTQKSLVCDIFTVTDGISVTFDNSSLQRNVTLYGNNSVIYWINGAYKK